MLQKKETIIMFFVFPLGIKYTIAEPPTKLFAIITSVTFRPSKLIIPLPSAPNSLEVSITKIKPITEQIILTKAVLKMLLFN